MRRNSSFPAQIASRATVTVEDTCDIQSNQAMPFNWTPSGIKLIGEGLDEGLSGAQILAAKFKDYGDGPMPTRSQINSKLNNMRKKRPASEQNFATQGSKSSRAGFVGEEDRKKIITEPSIEGAHDLPEPFRTQPFLKSNGELYIADLFFRPSGVIEIIIHMPASLVADRQVVLEVRFRNVKPKDLADLLPFHVKGSDGKKNGDDHAFRLMSYDNEEQLKSNIRESSLFNTIWRVVER